MPTELLGKSLDELRALAVSLGEPAFRGAQLSHSFYAERQFDFARMTALPAPLRSRLAAEAAVTLPRIVRFAASAWANHILQLDVAATMPVGGDYATPLQVDLGSTWRFLRPFPLRAGFVLGGDQGIGFTGGFSPETRVLYLDVEGESLGGLFKKAKGAGGRVSLGVSC